ncbi:hypothetical protein N8310_09105 [Pseudomonadota bacterium]|nr:hypothetical protein [Pseudomonadota bacterium]
MKKILVTLFTMLLCKTSSAFADDEILLICTSTKYAAKYYFVINKSESVAKVMDVFPNSIVGKLTETENSYVLHFPKSKKRYETHVVIYRYSGKMEYQVGTPPFMEYNEKNRLILGKCSLKKNVKKF